ncbi:YL1-domain-containing protein [Myriangium duriaei CBS 260.36]|uniref:YL1-domain-containing protein n=1 Tax=Myriangium duriaei CBS 260.36 TaxID=1168546 RepID=A0A9P4IVH5_9PEZI|nr:YL1-domain-containing protein [Myriangium duriaei CBS 260.36]
MSDDSDSSDLGSSPPPETLIAGRAKRSTAGNRLSHLLQHLDDEDIKADLLADQEDDQKDYSASEDDDADVALDSSDDSEDEAKEGEDQDLVGEKELRKEERVESKRKRKARELVRIQPLKKKVKILEEATSQDGTPVAPKKADRITFADLGPTRQSSRSQTVANAKVTAANLKESRRRAQRTQEIMRIAAEKKAAEAGPKLTQADRMARALEIEKENSRSLNRWEKSERERLRIQQEKLDAMRNRKIEGPVYRYWSGPVTWLWREGPDGPVYKRCKYDRDIRSKVEEMEVDGEEHHRHGPQDRRASLGKAVDAKESQQTQQSEQPNDSQAAQEKPQDQSESIKQQSTDPTKQQDKPQVGSTSTEQVEAVLSEHAEVKQEQQPEPYSEPQSRTDTEIATQGQDATPDAAPTVQIPDTTPFRDADQAMPDISGSSEKETSPADQAMPDTPAPSENNCAAANSINTPLEDASFLDGIHFYASSPASKPITEPQPAAPSILISDADSTTLMAPYTTAPANTEDNIQLGYLPSLPPYIHNPYAPKPHHALPLLSERAARTLLILESFPDLSTPAAAPSRRASAVHHAATPADPALSRVLMPDAHPALSAEEKRYLTAKPRRGGSVLPAPPARAMCAVSGRKAKFRDPKTRLAYADLAASKAIQRVLANGCQWSALLGVWAGIVGEGSLGRVARGVPEGFWTGKVKEEKKEPEVIEIL